MSWLSKSFKKSKSSSSEQYCSWLLSEMNSHPMSADEIYAHVVKCPTCREFAEKRGMDLSEKETTSPEKSHPSTIQVGVSGNFNLSELTPVVEHHAELVILGSCSPAYNDLDIQLEKSLEFKTNTKLVVVLERQPNKIQPLCLDPMIIVRRSFLRDVINELSSHTLSELGIELVVSAEKRGLNVGYI